MLKIDKLKLANSIKCGPNEETMLTSRHYNMYLADNGITILCEHIATKKITGTTMFNTIWWTQDNWDTVTTEPDDPIRLRRPGRPPKRPEEAVNL